MRRIFLLACTLLLSISCGIKEKEDVAIISATVSHPKEEAIALYSHDWKEVKKLHLKDGSLTDTIIHPEGKYFLSNGNDFAIPVYLSEGYQLQLNFDRNQPETSVTFSGKGALTNEYIKTKTEKTTAFRTSLREIFAANEQDFLKKVDEYAKDLEEELKKVDDKDFVKKQQKEIHFTSVEQKYAYERTHASLVGDPNFKVSENFPKVLDEINLNNEEDFKELKDIDSYKTMVINKFFTPIYEEIKKQSTPNRMEMMKMAVQKLSEMKEGDVRDFLALFTFQGIGEYNKRTAPLFDTLLSLVKNQEDKSKLEEAIADFRKREAGKPAPVFTDLEGIDGKTHSLSDFKGKLVYIDIWATWCGPCREEIPHLKQLIQKYQGKDVAFVSISVDKNKETWKQFVQEKQLSGVQLHEDDKTSNFTKDFDVNSIPRFILIGKKGEIIASNAPRPSEEKDLEALFKENGI